MPVTRDLIVLAVAALVLLGGVWLEARSEARGASWNGATRAYTWLAAVLAAALLGVAMFGANRAHGRDLDGRYAATNPDLKAWFDSLRSGKGPCCSDADGTALSDSDWESRDGRYRVRVPSSTIPGQDKDMIWVDVPDDAVITEPNRVGRTMVWPIYGYMGVTIRCFMPGSMT